MFDILPRWFSVDLRRLWLWFFPLAVLGMLFWSDSSTVFYLNNFARLGSRGSTLVLSLAILSSYC